MKVTFTSILFSLTLFLGKAIACDCLPVPSFCETITYNNNGQIHDQAHIFQVEVTTKQASGISVFVAKTYFGENLTGHTLDFEDGTGADCDLFFNDFQVGETYIFAAHQRAATKWGLSFCGVTFLKVENGIVSGAIAPGIEQVALAEFQNVAGCGELNPDNEPPVQPDIQFFVEPTLVSNELKIKTNHLFGADFDLQIFDAVGRLVHWEKVAAFNFYHTLIVDVQAWSAGVYFVRMEMVGRRETVKIVKQ